MPERTHKDNRYSRQPDQETGNNSQIDLLSTVVRNPGGTLYLGWTKDGRPSIGKYDGDLTRSALESLQSSQAAGIRIREIRYRGVVPYEYRYTGSAVDFSDDPTSYSKTEDLIKYGIVDSDGTQKVIHVGEADILQSISENNIPWQSVDFSTSTEIAVSAKPMYSVFVPQKGETHSACVLLFKPSIKGESNEAVFKSFVRETIGRLLILDELQEPEKRKGYLEVAAKLTKGPKSGDAADFIRMFVDVDDELAKKINKTARGIFAKFAGMFIEFDEETLENIKNPLPNYDVDTLDTEKLVGLASQMAQVARRQIKR